MSTKFAETVYLCCNFILTILCRTQPMILRTAPKVYLQVSLDYFTFTSYSLLTAYHHFTSHRYRNYLMPHQFNKSTASNQMGECGDIWISTYISNNPLFQYVLGYLIKNHLLINIYSPVSMYTCGTSFHHQSYFHDQSFHHYQVNINTMFTTCKHVMRGLYGFIQSHCIKVPKYLSVCI